MKPTVNCELLNLKVGHMKKKKIMTEILTGYRPLRKLTYNIKYSDVPGKIWKCLSEKLPPIQIIQYHQVKTCYSAQNLIIPFSGEIRHKPL